MWSYFQDIAPPVGTDQGNILYAMFDWGWFWVIPLQSKFSVGMVIGSEHLKRKRTHMSLEEIFQQAVASCPTLNEALSPARRIDEFRWCSDYSRKCATYFNRNVLVVGDAACFIDPILSTGVHLAMRGGLLAGLSLNTILAGGNESEALLAFENLYRQEYQRLLKASCEQYDLNRTRSHRFWRARRILESDALEDDCREERRAFVRLLAGLEGDDPSQVIREYRKFDRFVQQQFGYDRFDNEKLMHLCIQLTNGRLSVRSGYCVGATDRLTFARSLLVENNTGVWYPVNKLTIELLRLFVEPTLVSDAIQKLNEKYEIPLDYIPRLRRVIAKWLGRGVLSAHHNATTNSA